MRDPEYREGPKATEKFEEAMKKLFQIPKSKLSKKQRGKATTLKKKPKSDKG